MGRESAGSLKKGNNKEGAGLLSPPFLGCLGRLKERRGKGGEGSREGKSRRALAIRFISTKV